MKKKHEVSIKPPLDKKKILLVSRWGESLDLAYAMFLEGAHTPTHQWPIEKLFIIE